MNPRLTDRLEDGELLKVEEFKVKDRELGSSRQGG